MARTFPVVIINGILESGKTTFIIESLKNGDFGKMKIKIARHYGLCGGVKRALNIVEEALKECNGEILYIFHEIVHNTFVINELKKSEFTKHFKENLNYLHFLNYMEKLHI